MALGLKHFVPILVFIGFSIMQGYYVNSQSTTPWPALEAPRRTQNPSTTASLKRDFVSQPYAWNKPLVQPANTPANAQHLPLSRSDSSPRDYVNPNIQLSYSKTVVGGADGGGSPPTPAPRSGMSPGSSSARRDYVNPNIQLSYSNIAPGENAPPTSKQSIPTQSQSQNPANTPPRSPSRDYVNPNIGKPSYSNVAKANAHTSKSPSSSSLPPQTSPFPGSNNSNTNSQQSTTPNPKVRQDENSELQEFSESLLRKDTNNGFKYVKVNYQGMTRSNSLNDEAPENLMTIDPEAFKVPTVEKLLALHNNYLLRSNENEVYTAQERVEENAFLDAILSTPVMQHTRNFLIAKGKISKDPKDFKDVLRTIWFTMYSRGGGRIGSSGFEHVYLTEIKNDVISGLHNWIYFHEEEKKKTANYLGYLKKLEFDKGAILKFHFKFQNIDKPVGSMFLGTSPELELALYSTCFLVRPDDVCPLRLGGKNFVIRTYTYRYRGKNMIGSAFPEI